MQNLRRKVSQVHVGNLLIGAPEPVSIQSMTTTPTLDTAASVAQAASIAAAGAQLVRLTAQGVSHAANLANIKAGLLEKGVDTPLVADIHFNPAAAFEAALHVEKVAAATFSRKGTHPAPAGAGIFHYHLKMMAVKNVRNVFCQAENAPPDRQSRSIRFQSCGRLYRIAAIRSP